MTIINRRTFVAERGKFQEAIDLLRGATKGARHKYRICSSYYGAFDAIALEVEFESLAQMEEAWAEVNAQPEMAEFLNKWYAATQPGGSNEVWILEAQG
jgi:hypothetical protein